METNNRDYETDEGRRSALKKIAAGAGFLAGCAVLPERWTQPIIGQIVLPAHAGTSGSTLHDPCTVTVTAGDQGSTSVTVLVSGFVTPPTSNVPVHIVATATGGSGASVSADTATDADGNFSVSLAVGGGSGITAVSATTTATGATGSATCSVNVGAAAPPEPALPALTQCTMEIQSGTQGSNSIQFGVVGSVNPPTAGVPVQIVFTAEGIAETLAWPFDIVTVAGGTYGLGTEFTNGPGYTRVTAVVTSTGATGTTTCFDDVPV